MTQRSCLRFRRRKTGGNRWPLAPVGKTSLALLGIFSVLLVLSGATPYGPETESDMPANPTRCYQWGDTLRDSVPLEEEQERLVEIRVDTAKALEFLFHLLIPLPESRGTWLPFLPRPKLPGDQEVDGRAPPRVPVVDDWPEESALRASGKPYRLAFRNKTFTVLGTFPDSCTVSLHWLDPKGRRFSDLDRLRRYLMGQGSEILLLTNAGMFRPDGSPQGLYVEDGHEWRPLDLGNPDGTNFYLKPNGVFALVGSVPYVLETDSFLRWPHRHAVTQASQSGPMLVWRGELHPAFREGSANRHYRSGIGVSKDGHLFFAISDQPTNFFDFGLFFRDVLECPNALYLDGAISLCYAPPKRQDLGGWFGPMLSFTKP